MGTEKSISGSCKIKRYFLLLFIDATPPLPLLRCQQRKTKRKKNTLPNSVGSAGVATSACDCDCVHRLSEKLLTLGIIHWGPPHNPPLHHSAAMLGVITGPSWCREAPASRTAVRLIVVETPPWVERRFHFRIFAKLWAGKKGGKL